MMNPVVCSMLVLALVVPVWSGERAPTGPEEAHAICYALRDVSIVSECDVSVRNHTVDLRIATDAKNAREMCGPLAAGMVKHAPRLAKDKWQLRIFSPYSGDHPLVTCRFQ